jgi:hypothetical protein
MALQVATPMRDFLKQIVKANSLHTDIPQNNHAVQRLTSGAL